MQYGKVIKLLRVSNSISQISLAKKLEVSRSYLSQVENNRKSPSLSFLKEVANFFQIPLALLVMEESNSDSDIFKKLNNILSELLTTKLKLGEP
jgi:transcriptional regulator with XRE-family HTH domain